MRFAMVVAITLTSCASTTPEQRAERAREKMALDAQLNAIRIEKADPPASCQDVGTVSGGSYMADEDDVRRQMRKEAVKKGGNLIRLDGMRPGYSTGTAFRCP